jgi:uncharacterized ion transporter superfamily protein YfcC
LVYNAMSVAAANAMVPTAGGSTRIAMPLHSPLYEALNVPISVLILDESYTAKNADSQINRAV